MSAPSGCGCDPEKVFELVDEGLSLEQEWEIREHLIACPGCRELYERERSLNAFLSSLDFSGVYSRSVHKGVAMALPTRTVGARILWGLLAGVLLVAALVSLELNGMEPMILVTSILSACWGYVAGSANVAQAVFAAAGTTILLLLAFGALADFVIALAVISRVRGRRAREV